MANVIATTIEGLGMFAGPALAGLVLAVSGMEATLVVMAVALLWSALLVLPIKETPPVRRRGAVTRLPGVPLRRVRRHVADAGPPPADRRALRPGADGRLHQRPRSSSPPSGCWSSARAASGCSTPLSACGALLGAVRHRAARGTRAARPRPLARRERCSGDCRSSRSPPGRASASPSPLSLSSASATRSSTSRDSRCFSGSLQTTCSRACSESSRRSFYLAIGIGSLLAPLLVETAGVRWALVVVGLFLPVRRRRPRQADRRHRRGGLRAGARARAARARADVRAAAAALARARRPSARAGGGRRGDGRHRPGRRGRPVLRDRRGRGRRGRRRSAHRVARAGWGLRRDRPPARRAAHGHGHRPHARRSSTPSSATRFSRR